MFALLQVEEEEEEDKEEEGGGRDEDGGSGKKGWSRTLEKNRTCVDGVEEKNLAGGREEGEETGRGEEVGETVEAIEAVGEGGVEGGGEEIGGGGGGGWKMLISGGGCGGRATLLIVSSLCLVSAFATSSCRQSSSDGGGGRGGSRGGRTDIVLSIPPSTDVGWCNSLFQFRSTLFSLLLISSFQVETLVTSSKLNEILYHSI